MSSPHWFRIAYSRNAFLRHLASLGLELGSLTPEDGIAAMRSFMHEYRPQHGELDTLTVRGTTATRRMQRHDQPVSTLTLSFRDGVAALVQS